MTKQNINLPFCEIVAGSLEKQIAKIKTRSIFMLEFFIWNQFLTTLSIGKGHQLIVKLSDLWRFTQRSF